MRSLVYIATALAVMGLAFWAYRENYATQQALDEVDTLNREIGHLRERLALLNAEWAYLNRPDRLRAMVEMNFDALGLVAMDAARFGTIDQVAYPAPELPALSGLVELRATVPALAGAEAAQ